MTNKILSLSRVRKSRDKMKKRIQAAENAVKFGFHKDVKNLKKAQNTLAEKRLEGHLRED